MLDTHTSIYTAPKYHYTYWITNIKLQKHYIGVRTSKIPPIHDIGIKYFSSSSDKEFKKDQKDNPQDYDYKIIGLFPTREEASMNEVELHETYNVGKNPRFYNLCKVTSIGFDTSGTTHTEKAKDKISESQKNAWTEERKDNHSAAHLGTTHKQETKDKISASLLGKKKEPFSEEHKANMSTAQLGIKKEPHKQETKDKISESHKNLPPFSEEHKAKISASMLGKKKKTGTCPHCGRVMGLGGLKRFHLDNCKLKSISASF
jgi:hypothetical protein